MFLRGKGRRKSKTPEGEFKAAVVEYLKIRFPNVWIFNVVGGPIQRPGIPDLLVCLKGRLLALEIKNPARPTPLSPAQQREIDAINYAGGVAGRVASWDELEELLKRLEGG